MFNDPRLALFGLTLLSRSDPKVLEQIQSFSNWLKQTGETLRQIHTTMCEYETSMKALASPKETFQSQVALETNTLKNQTNKVITRLSETDLDQLQSFLDELNQLILKYGKK